MITPQLIITLVIILFVVRVVLSIRPIVAGTAGRSRAFAREYLDVFIFAGAAAWFVTTFIGRTYYIPSGSMLPTLHIGDLLVVDKFEYRFHAPHDGDIAVFPPPLLSSDDFIKRVIGSPGDRIKVAGGTVFRNGVALKEPYIAQNPDYSLEIRNYGIYVNDGFGWQRLDPSQANIPPRKDWLAPDRIPPHCFLMFGDNRNDSEDSHVWGFAQDTGRFYSGPRAGHKASFTGRAVLIFWPFSQARLL
ncbi:MAG TPA: signal peptidase I [Candidatus Dormibacteraeota bacterium]|nr:signal peptidase I [Candidatus Dormibacteraeota bacterium]